VFIECGPIFASGLLKLGQDNKNSDLEAKFFTAVGCSNTKCFSEVLNNTQ
jgi:hypothetical protein